MEKEIFKSKNMNYIYNIEYFEGMKSAGDKIDFSNCEFNDKNEGLVSFVFSAKEKRAIAVEGKSTKLIALYTAYPGLLVGTGNTHDVKADSGLKCGFTFDYVTGLPYIPGSSVKGALRSYFPSCASAEEDKNEYREMIKGFLESFPSRAGLAEMDLVEIDKLEAQIFDNNDVFIDAFPEINEDTALMELEYITPHTGGPLKNPKPIQLIKVKPNVKFVFTFLLNDYVSEDGSVTITAEEKKMLFEEIILCMGMGAKTNVGFGNFTKEITKQNKVEVKTQGSRSNNNGKYSRNQGNGQRPNYNQRQANQSKDVPLCSFCKKKVTWNSKLNRYNTLCTSCFREQRNNSNKR